MTLAIFFVAAALWQEPRPAPPSAGAQEAVEIDWVRRPMPEFPERAVRVRVREGEVRVRCTLTPAGRFADCEVTSESPARVGFGPAALSAIRGARFRPAAEGPQPGDAYETTLRFEAPPEHRRRRSP